MFTSFPIHVDTPVTIGTSPTAFLTLETNTLIDTIQVQLKNTGSVTTNGLELWRKLHPDGDWLPWLIGTDFALLAGPAVGIGGGLLSPPTAIAPGVDSYLDLDTRWCGVAIQLRASVASGTTTLKVFGSGRAKSH